MASGRALALLGLAALSAPAAAELSAEDLDALRALRDQAARIQEETAEVPVPPWLQIFPDMPGWQDGEELGAEAGDAARRKVLGGQQEACRDLGGDCTLPEELATPGAEQSEPVVTILVSRSLGDGALRQIFAAASGHEDIRILFRGVREGESLGDFLRATAIALRDLDPPPNVAIDPGPFRDWGITQVPAVVLSGPDGEIARVTGLSSATWLREQVETGRTGDLGQRGPTMDIEEPDMIAEIHRRVAAIDWHARKEQAIARWWERARFEHLSPATEPRKRLIDPTLEIYQDIRAPNGQFVARAGERINPLDNLPFTMRLVVFDATSPKQVQMARELGQAPGGLRPVYIATRFDRDAGWDGFNAVEDAIDDPVYLLTPDLRERFALEYVPATIEAQGRAFVVREYAVPRS
jgi:conjugal transfer pilus assembly protein TraW